MPPINLEIEIGNSRNTLQSLDDFNSALSQIATMLDDMPDFTEAVAGGKNQVKSLNSQVSELSKTTKDLTKIAQKASEKGILDAKQLEGVNDEIQTLATSLDGVGSKVNEYLANTTFELNASVESWGLVRQQVRELRKQYTGLLAEQTQATTVKEWEAAARSISQVQREIQTAEEALRQMEDASAFMRRSGGDFFTINTDIKEIEAFVEMTTGAANELVRLNAAFAGAESANAFSDMTLITKDIERATAALSEQEKHYANIVDYNKTLLYDIETLASQEERLLDIRRKSNDPRVLQVVSEKLDEINKQQEQAQAQFFDESTTDSFMAAAMEMEQPIRRVIIAQAERKKVQAELFTAERTGNIDAQQAAIFRIEMLENEIEKSKELNEAKKVAAKNAIANEQALRMEVAEMRSELVELEQLRRATYDRQTIELIIAKEKELNDVIQQRTDELREMQSVRASGGSGGTMSETGASPKIEGGFSKVSAGLNTIGGRLDSLGLTFEVQSDQIDKYGNEIEGTSVTVGNMLSNIGGIIEQQQTQFQSISQMQDEIKVGTERLENWRSQIAASNKATLAGGKQLSSWQKGMGALGKNLGGLTKVLGMASKAVGFAGAAFQGVMIGIQVHDLITGKSAAQIEARMNAMKSEIGTTQKLNELIRQGSEEARKARINELQQEINDKKMLLQANRDNLMQNTSTINQLRTIASYKLGLNKVYGQAGEEVKNLEGNIDDLEKQMEELTSSATRASIKLAEFNDSMQKMGADALQEAERRTQELFDARVEIIKTERDTNQQLLDAQTEYNNETQELLESRDNEDRERLRNHLNDLSNMERDYNNKVTEMKVDHYEELNDMEEDYLENLAELVRDYEEERAQTVREFQQAQREAEVLFQEEEIEAGEDYRKKLAKMEEDFNKERIKRQKDLEDQLFEAEIENDALRFFMLRREGEKAEKEAQEQYDEEHSEAEKEYQESKTERRKQFEEQQAERREEHREEMAAMKEAHTVNLAERKRQFDEELQAAKDAFSERLKAEEEMYAEERANAVKAFREQMREIESERRKEDQRRIERLAERRKEIETAFQLELEYFEKREKALAEFIGKITSLENRRTGFERFFEDGGGNLSQDDAQFLLDRINEQMGNIERLAPGGDVSQLGEQDRVAFAALQDVANDMSEMLNNQREAGHYFAEYDFDSLVDEAALSAAGVDITSILTETINTTLQGQMASVEDAMQIDLTYFNQEMRDIATLVTEIQSSGATVFEDLSTQHQETLRSMGLNQTEWNMMTVDEQKQFLDNQAEILAEQGEQSTEELRQTAQTIGDEAIGTFEQIEEDNRVANEQIITDSEKHQTERETGEVSFQDDLTTAQDLAHEDRLTDDEYFQEAATALGAETNDEILGTQEDGQSARIESGERFNEESALQQEAANESALNSNDELNQNLEEQDAEHNANELTREEEQHLERERIAQDFFEAELQRMFDQFTQRQELMAEEHRIEMEKLVMKFELENEMWAAFMEGLAKLFENETKKLFNDVERTIGQSGQRIVGLYGRINQAIVQGAQSTFSALQRYAQQAASAASRAQSSANSRRNSGYGSSSESRPARSSRPTRNTGGNRGVLAAKGALIDQPTLLIAGEGENPELVMPFDESEGIPDKTMAMFMQSMSDGVLNNIEPQAVGGNMSDQILLAMLSELRTLQTGMNMTIERIEVGSNISREEIREQFGSMQKSIVNVVNKSVNTT